MTINEIIENEEFLKLLDSEDSEKMTYYIATQVDTCWYRYLAEMFNDLGIFQDIALYSANPKKKYKYIVTYAFGPTTCDTIDLRGALVYYNGVANPVGSEIIVDETTIIKSYGIWITPNYKSQKFKLTFLGVPKIKQYGIAIYPKLLDQVEIYAKANIVNEIKELFDKNAILTDKKSLKNKIKKI